MHKYTSTPLIQTIKERCKVCYTCVRECPAKAIRISGGQAEVIIERCIGCGNCMRVCTQHAKEVRNSISEAEQLITSKNKTAACIAPSFPAEFYNTSYKKVVGMLRKLGFDYVIEVAFGADLVSKAYNKTIKNTRGHHIATTCPAIVSYVEKLYPDMVENLLAIGSPMVAIARVVHEMYGKDTKVVFIGPCLAKKDEADRGDDVAEALTFSELRMMLYKNKIESNTIEPSDFDPPHPGKGALYPVGRGMLQSSNLEEDLMSTDIIATDGTKQFTQALKEFEKEKESVKLLELLCCNGCIMGPGMASNLSQFARRGRISNYARRRYNNLDSESWEKNIEKFKNLDLSIEFHKDDQRQDAPTREELKQILRKKGKFNPEDELNCGACGYDTCIDHASAIYRGLAETEMCLPYTIENLKSTAKDLAQSYEDLLMAKKALIQTEKLASLGRLASGIAHEINNPLTGVLTFSSLLLEDLGNTEHKEDLETIVNETTRCRDIVRGLLDFARESKSVKEPANLNSIITDTLSILGKHLNFQKVDIHLDLSPEVPVFNMDINQMKSVINNLAINAADAMPEGGELSIQSRFDAKDKNVEVKITDTGSGISEENVSKIFDPFFTTKQAGKGTGLGLAVIYGIIERHKGTVHVNSVMGEGTTFTMQLPIDNDGKWV
ncbi:MAG: 4Fe-4S dicluster domain-containing protein [bacterium]|nr:4Fe-4S dicluster domain-containing protein [bacterium]